MNPLTTHGLRYRTSGTSADPRACGHRRRPNALPPHRIAWLALLGLSSACHDAHGPLSPAAHDATVALSIASASSLIENVVQPFGTFGGVRYVRHSGRFVGTTTLGEFRVPYEIVAPADPALGNGTVLFEPPHFAFGLLGRDLTFGADLLFRGGYSHAAVGFGENGLNILDPTAADAIIKGAPVENPGSVQFALPPDVEIIIEFVNALAADPVALDALGGAHRRYAYGASQTAAALLETFLTPGGTGLFDLTLLQVAMWKPPFAQGEFPRSEGEFEPLADVGRVIFVESEADLLLSEAEQFRDAVSLPGYRVYEVAGAPHAPSSLVGLPTPPGNSLDHAVVARAAFVRGDEWVRTGRHPPPSTLLETAPEGEADPLFGFPTGMARDADLNALGGVRLPDLHVGRALFLATNPASPDLVGFMEDLTCVPRAGSDEGPRFRNHGSYVGAVARQANHLQQTGFLLPEDAELIKETAGASEVGKRGSCPG